MGFPNQRGSFETPDLEGTGHGLCALPRSFSVSRHGQPWSLQGKKVHTGFAQVQGLPGHPKGKLLARATADLSLVPTAGRAQQCGTVWDSVGQRGHAVSEVWDINTAAHEFTVCMRGAQGKNLLGGVLTAAKVRFGTLWRACLRSQLLSCRKPLQDVGWEFSLALLDPHSW